MSRPIKISEQHGLNPSITICFFCHKETGIALLGKLKGDAKAPQRIVADYTPCPECAEKQKLGVTCIEVTQEENGLPPIKRGVWPTGSWCIIKKEIAEQLFRDATAPTVLLEDMLYQKLFRK